MMKNKVLIFSHEFPPDIGGAGVVAKELAKVLSEHSEVCLDVTVITNYNKKRSKDCLYDLIEVKTTSKIRSFQYMLAFRKLDLKIYDSIILNDIHSIIFAAIFLTKEDFKKTVVYLHGNEPENIFKSHRAYDKIIGIKRLYMKSLYQCKKIIAVSQYMKDTFINETKLNNLEDKIKVAYHGIDVEKFHRAPIDLYEKYKIPTERKLILSASRLVREKGYSRMYDIYKKMIKNGHRYHWLIVGDGNFKAQLEHMILIDKMQSNITFVGQVDREMLRYYYSSVDLFWLLSEYEESLGLVYIEASACGCPVIGNNKGGVKEAILPGSTGYLVNDNLECIDILEHEKYKSLDTLTSYDFILKFDIRKNIENILDIYLN